MDKLTGQVGNLSHSVSKLSADVDKLSLKLDAAQSVGERLERLATSLIAGAMISIIASVILVSLREGSRPSLKNRDPNDRDPKVSFL